jgi:hypothetical protein
MTSMESDPPRGGLIGVVVLMHKIVADVGAIHELPLLRHLLSCSHALDRWSPSHRFIRLRRAPVGMHSWTL